MSKPTPTLLQESGIRKRVRAVLAVVADCLGRPLAPPDVHRLRRALKQLRAWCRLLAAGGQPDARRLKNCLRDLAAHYGAARDAQVQLETLQQLEAQHGLHFPCSVRRLQVSVPALVPAPEAAACEEYRSALQRLQQLLERGLPPESALLRGLARSRRKAGKLCVRAWRSRESEALHELRKAVKTLANQYALCVNRQGAAGLEYQRLDQLGKELGKCHDLAILRASLAGQADTAGLRRELARITALTDAEETALWQACRNDSAACFPGKLR